MACETNLTHGVGEWNGTIRLEVSRDVGPLLHSLFERPQVGDGQALEVFRKLKFCSPQQVVDGNVDVSDLWTVWIYMYSV